MEHNITQTPLINNEAEGRFELTIDGHTAFVVYELSPVLTLMHTEVPEALGGRGIGKVLAEKVFTYLQAKGKKAKVLCPFLVAYVKRHPEWQGVTL